ncbi:MAG TPA: hypothetical protein VIY47_07435, partial [Ignavibacteriaceae bacterium]
HSASEELFSSEELEDGVLFFHNGDEVKVVSRQNEKLWTGTLNEWNLEQNKAESGTFFDPNLTNIQMLRLDEIQEFLEECCIFHDQGILEDTTPFKHGLDNLEEWSMDLNDLDRTVASPEELDHDYDTFKSGKTHTVTVIDHCTFIHGNLPVSELLKVMDKVESGNAFMDTHLASMAGATMVFGTKEALDQMKKSKNFPLNPERVKESELAELKGLPSGFCEWLKTGERGLSSNFMASKIFGIPENAPMHYPHDPADLKRCIMFLQASQAKNWGKNMDNCGPEWNALLPRWKELKLSLKDEIQNPDLKDKAPKTYELMKNLLTRPVTPNISI